MDVLQKFTDLGGQLDTGLALAKCVLAVLAAGVGVYLVGTVGGLLSPGVRFLFGVRAGEPLGPLVGGFMLGLRLFVWAAGLAAIAAWVMKDRV